MIIKKWMEEKVKKISIVKRENYVYIMIMYVILYFRFVVISIKRESDSCNLIFLMILFKCLELYFLMW